MVEVFSENEYEQLLLFIKQYPHGVSQPDIIKHFSNVWYKGVIDQKTRIKIGYRLKVMENKLDIKKWKLHSGKGIPTNIWCAIDG